MTTQLLYFRFIRAYKDQNGAKSLESFYEDYHVDYDARGPAGLVIRMLNVLRKSNNLALKKAADKFFLVSVYMEAPTTNTDLPSEWQHSHVAGRLFSFFSR